MGVDITSDFRGCVETVRAQVKAFRGIDGTLPPQKQASRRACPFNRRCLGLLTQIVSLRDFLLKTRKPYLALGPEYLAGGEIDALTEEERDQVDAGAQDIIKTCSTLITDAKRELYSTDENNQLAENHKAVIDLLEAYLKTVCAIYTEQKAIRVKWTVEAQKMSKLESGHETSPNSSLPNFKTEDKVREGTSFTPVSYGYDEDNEITAEEMQMFELENDQLFNELNSLNDEIKSIQTKVVKIAELQEVFTEKVLQQNEDIERISSTIVGTTENLKDANTQLRQAIQSNASFRIYVLFFILVMSFCLLFLDWYND